jgi:hypothetical protein
MRLSRIAFAVLAATLPALAQTAPAPAAPTRPTSSSLTLVVEGKATVYSMADLAALPHKSVTVHNARTNTDSVYSGVPLYTLLLAHGGTFAGGEPQLHKMLRCYLAAHSTDDYFVTLSTIEVFPDYHAGDVIVADSKDGQPIVTNGALELVSSEDKRTPRMVYSLSKIVLLESPGN